MPSKGSKQILIEKIPAVPALRYQVAAVSAGPAERLCMALEMLLIASSLPLTAVCISSRTRCKESSISCLISCCNVIKSAVVAMPACHYATAVAAADIESLQVTPLAMALFRAPLP